MYKNGVGGMKVGTAVFIGFLPNVFLVHQAGAITPFRSKLGHQYGLIGRFTNFHLIVC